MASLVPPLKDLGACRATKLTAALIPAEFLWVLSQEIMEKRGKKQQGISPTLTLKSFPFSLHRPKERASLRALFLCIRCALLGLGLPLSPV